MSQSSQRNYWGRNWKWLVPVGCLGTLILLVGFAGLVFLGVMGMVKSSDAYRQALSKARDSPAAVAVLGEPIGEGFFTTGSLNVTGPSGTAELAIPIFGPKGKGTIYVEARKSLGEWSFSKLVVETEADGKRIDLLNQPSTPR